MAQILCEGPGPHDPIDGVLGESSVPQDGMRCASPACQPAPPEVTPDPLAALDPRIAAIPVDTAVATVERGLDPTKANPTTAERLAALEVLVAELSARAAGTA